MPWAQTFRTGRQLHGGNSVPGLWPSQRGEGCSALPGLQRTTMQALHDTANEQRAHHPCLKNDPAPGREIDTT